MGVTLCDSDDLINRLGGRELTPAETAAWPGCAEEASVLIEGFLEKEWTDLDAVPRHVRVVCSRMVVRTFDTAGTPGGQLGGTMLPGTKSFNSSMGPMGHTTTFGEDVVFGSPWLSKADRLSLRKGRYPVTHVPMYPEGVGDPTGYDFAERYGY